MKSRIRSGSVSNRFASACLVALLLLLSAGWAQAEQFERVGDYKIYYSAVNTSFLTPEVASANNIQRSKVLALLNVSVREQLENGEDRAVNATVNGQVSNQAGQAQSLSFRRVQDGEAIYYLSTFRIQPDEPMTFELDVTYDANQPPAEVNFIQRFYIDP